VIGSPPPPISLAALISDHVCSGVGGTIWRYSSGGNFTPNIGSANARPRRNALGPFLPASMFRSNIAWDKLLADQRAIPASVLPRIWGRPESQSLAKCSKLRDDGRV
jgi:hypothetical protein